LRYRSTEVKFSYSYLLTYFHDRCDNEVTFSVSQASTFTLLYWRCQQSIFSSDEFSFPLIHLLSYVSIIMIILRLETSSSAKLCLHFTLKTTVTIKHCTWNLTQASDWHRRWRH